ncbi:D-arabinono-1,4-lactone oxidase [Streptosporangium sandarakinum]|uniref:FAD/FMN-containing dehydrogenase n=1 Tax=Streptosporangium sandarakinum TaxID=1260955 RepID=A0A852VDV6_9ACTN|nr:D-arabinono-1,4-lactone oxidase [Streptosporangium sandarakinum]NYF44561.1 FAD/FMN-containing dehydrogenase [Streptosporangium sandarakinum]
MTLTNWSGNVAIAGQGQWTRITSLEQLASMLTHGDAKVRVLGSRFTYPTQLHCPDRTHGIVLDLPGRGVCDLRGEHLRVTGDTLLDDVWKTFDRHGLEPAACPPVITAQTVAGALATGTHAQGMYGGTLSDCVSAIDLMDGTGVLHRLTPADDDFESAILNLGCLGVVVGLELRGRLAAQMRCSRITVPADSLPELYPVWNIASTAAKCWWFTEHEVAHAWITHDGDSPPRDGHTADLNDVVARTRRHLMADIGDGQGRTPATRTLEKFLCAADAKGTLYEIFKNGIPAPQLNMEIAVPLDVFGEAFASLKELLSASSYKLHYPVILRTTGPARGHLSPTSAAPSTYFGFVSYMNAEGRITAARPLFDDIQRLLYGLGGRPHWGKYFTPELVRAAGTGGFPQFRRAVGRFDPRGRFENDTFYRTLGLPTACELEPHPCQ